MSIETLKKVKIPTSYFRFLRILTKDGTHAYLHDNFVD